MAGTWSAPIICICCPESSPNPTSTSDFFDSECHIGQQRDQGDVDHPPHGTGARGPDGLVRPPAAPLGSVGGVSPLVLDDDGGHIVGNPGLRVERRSRHGETWLRGPDPLDADLDGPDRAAFADLVRTLADRAVLVDRATAVHWESDGPAPAVDAIAAAADLPERRDILRMERSLPLPSDLVADAPALALRPFRPGTADEEAWVRTNNRSFAHHPDQGRETVASLRATMAEPWFDPTGLLVLDGDPPIDDGGPMVGSCWTKLHPAGAEDAGAGAGEIYVIGVDPDAAGHGLGRGLVVAGLAHLAAVGADRALLFVEADNAAARRLYDRLGFTTTRTRRVRSRISS